MKNKKKVNITKKPERTTVHPVEMVDDWVLAQSKNTDKKSQPMHTEELIEKSSELVKKQFKRFTLDVPFDLHMQIKVSCAKRGLNMSDEIRKLLVQEFLQR